MSVGVSVGMFYILMLYMCVCEGVCKSVRESVSRYEVQEGVCTRGRA